MNSLSELMERGEKALAAETAKVKAQDARDKILQRNREKEKLEAKMHPLIMAISALKSEPVTAKILADVKNGLEEIEDWESNKILLINEKFEGFFRIRTTEKEPSTDPDMWGFVMIYRDDEICIEDTWVDFKRFLKLAEKGLET